MAPALIDELDAGSRDLNDHLVSTASCRQPRTILHTEKKRNSSYDMTYRVYNDCSIRQKIYL